MALTEKALSAAEKQLGKEFIKELQTLDAQALKQKVVDANQGMKAAKEELEANPKYQEASSDLAYLKGGLNDVNKRQKQIIAYSLHLLEEKGKL